MRALHSALLLFLTGCSVDPLPMLDGGPSGDPILAPALTWTWVDFPESLCDDGSATGIGVNLNPGSRDVLVFMNGGGACWDAFTCLQLGTAVHGPFGRGEFDRLSFGGSILDRGETRNPFKDYSLVFVPYCTGDLHGGDNVAGYDGVPYYHKGHHNMTLFLSRLAAAFPSPRKVVITGSSAGGYGAAINYPDVKARWPGARTYLIDDSGPALRGDAIAPYYRTAWYNSWRLDQVLQPLCGQACLDDISLVVQVIAASHPDDRLALLSSLRDATISGYLLLTPEGFQTELEKLAAEILDPAPNIRYFFIEGSSHTMLGAPTAELWSWLATMMSDELPWVTSKPY